MSHPNFNITEFKCKDGTPVPDELVDNCEELMDNLQVLRDHLGVPISVNSGYRTPTYNSSVGGARNSQHLKAKAADIRAKGYTPKQIHAAIELLISQDRMKEGGLGLYNSFVHYDIRGIRARWNYAT